jgi:hypothetical protein
MAAFVAIKQQASEPFFCPAGFSLAMDSALWHNGFNFSLLLRRFRWQAQARFLANFSLEEKFP